MKYFITLVKQDLTANFLERGYFFNMIFTLLLLIFSLYLVNEQTASIGALVVSFAIAAITQSHFIFQEDYDNHFLEQLVVSGCSSYIIVLSKIFVSYIILVLSAIIAILIFSLLNSMVFEKQLVVLAVFLIYSIPLSCVIVLSAALTTKVARSNFLNLLIAMPLMMVFFIYLSTILNSYISSDYVESIFIIDLQILGSLSLISGIISLFACSYLISKI